MPQQIDIVANLLVKVDNAEAGINKLKNSLSKLKIPDGLENSFKKSFSNLDTIFARYRSQVEKGFKTKGDVSAFTKTSKELDAELNRISQNFTKLTGKSIDFKVNTQALVEAQNKLDKLVEAREKLSVNTLQMKIETSGKMGTADIETLLKKFEELAGTSTKAGEGASKALISLRSGNTTAAVAEVNQLINGYKNLGKAKKEAFETQVGSNVTGVFQQVLQAVKQLDTEFEAADGKIKQVQIDLENTKANQVQKAGEAAQRAADAYEKEHSAINQANGALLEHASATQRAVDEVKQLQQSTQYFFSLRNMINLLKRGIREAVQTVKELDAAMTETAVVTQYSVGDMWAKLPEYTANANALGATIQDMYESTTLYYQQGLQTEAAMGIAAETMKMARIAGLEAKDATDMMTAALRGFNMELNNTSAERINDVYSNLAAKTASNTEELGKAMQRTASIAYSAGMSFEGTAAFLAQAIETTREPAENIGTAMKTIVARFQELKENPLEITEVDGEEVSYNKVDKALQSIGVSLKDTNGQFRELDQVFLDISKRWDGLTQTQQRYIATIAAGSRQQSRFIAMMNNYDRTVELMSYANDSEGASTEQFGKTLESMEAKLNKFQNAWKEFLMGIMDNTWTKRLVDGGTKVLNIVNDIINVLSFNGKAGLLKSGLSIFTAFTALKGVGRLANRTISGLGGLVDPTSSFGKGFWSANTPGSQGGIAGRITTPIVAKLNELIAVEKTKNGQGGQSGQPTKVVSSVADYEKARRLLTSGNLTFGSIRGQYNTLSDEHAYAAYRNTPGTVDAMKQATMGWFNSKQLNSETQKTGQQLMSAIYKGMKKKEIPVKDGIKLIGQPQKWGQAFGTDVAKNFSATYAKAMASQNAEKANQEALKYLVKDPTQYTMGSKALKDLMLNDNMREAYKQRYAAARKLLDEESLNNISVPLGKSQQLANTIGVLGSKFSAAGLSIQMFGAQLGQLSPALQGVGALISQVGTMVATFGMGISGIGTVVAKVGGQIAAGVAAVKYGSAAMAAAVASGAVAAETTAAATGLGAIKAFIGGFTGGMHAGPIAAIIGAVLLGAIALVKSHLEKKAKEAGEEVRNSFEKGFTENDKKINSLASNKDRYAELSEGVDKFGHNVSLSDEEYQEYLSISQELAELSPSLIAGYDAEGKAILRKADAIDEVIDKLEEEKQASLDNYVTNESINDLIGEYKTSDAYKNNHETFSGTTSTGKAVNKSFNSERTKLASSLSKAGVDWSDFSQMLNELGIGEAASVDALTDRQLILISDHYNDILNKIREFNPEIKEEAEEGLKEAFAGTHDSIEEVLSTGKPITDALQQWMGQEELDAVGLELGEEFISGFNEGFEGLMLEGLTKDWDPKKYKEEIQDYSEEWKKMAGSTSEYSDILREADSLQQDYLNHINDDDAVTNYENQVEDLAVGLEDLADTWENSGRAGQVFAQQCREQASELRNYATEAKINLTEALNTATDEIKAAEGALEEFNKATEKDYSTAAEGMKSIFDKVTETFKDSYETEIKKHSEGRGDATFWTGAEALLSEKAIKKATKGKDGYEAASAVAKKIQDLEPMLREGQEGFDAFTQRVLECAPAMDKLAEAGVKYDKQSGFITNIPDDQWHNVAVALGISDDLLTSMLNKGRQFASISFMNLGQVRKSLEESDFTIKGQQSNKNGQQSLYVKEETLLNRLAEAGYVREEEQQQQIDKLQNKQNIQVLKAAEAYEKGSKELATQFKDMGIKTLPDLITTLHKTGEFTEEEIRAYAENQGMIGDLNFDTVYSDLVSALDNPELAKQTNELFRLNTTATNILNNMNETSPQQQLEEAQEQRKQTFGDAGVDTNVEAFGLGQILDENGERQWMTPEQFETQKKYMSELTQTYRDNAAEAQAIANTTTGETSKSYQELADYWTNLADDVDRNYQTGLSAYESYLQQTEKRRREKEKADKKIEKKAEKVAPEINNKVVEGVEKVTKTTNEVVNKEIKETEEKVVVTGEEDPSFISLHDTLLTFKKDPIINFLIQATANEGNTPELEEKIDEVYDRVTEPVTITADSSDAIAKAAAAYSSITGLPRSHNTSINATDNTSSVISSIKIKLNSLKEKFTGIFSGPSGATGINNKISTDRIPSFGSAAKGHGGTVGPKNKGGLTLTGEKGFEIAWIPSENRSMILGASGPQMLNLPSDAVVYTHEQSKNILKRKSIPAGSHADYSGDSSSYHKKYFTFTQSTNISSGQKERKKKKNTNSENAAKEVIKITEKAGKVLVWWENAAHRMNKAQNTAENTQKKLDRLLLTFGTTLEQYSKLGETLEEDLNKVVSIADEKIAQAKKELKASDEGVSFADAGIPKKTKSEKNEQAAAKKKRDAAEKKLKAAKSNKKKKNTKANRKKYTEAKKEYEKAKKAYQGTSGYKKDAEKNAYAEAIGARVSVSYEKTKTVSKKNKKGKVTKTKSKVTENKTVNLADYITQDEDTKAYILDQKAISKLASKNKSLAEAVKEATEKQLNTLNSELESAESEKEDALQQLEEFYNNAYDAFNQWDKVITDVYLLSQQLEKLNKLNAIYEAVDELQTAKLEAGFGNIANSIDIVRDVLNKSAETMITQAKVNYEIVDSTWKEYQDAFSLETGIIELGRFENATNATKDLSSRTAALNFLKDIGFNENNFDYDKALEVLYKQRWQNEDYDKIKEGLDLIAEKQGAYYDALANTFNSLTDVYKKIEEYQSYMVDFEDSLVKGLEEQTDKEIDKLSKLNSTLDTAAKNLIDEVKRKLDERRKQEDNAKTEQDISQKQQRLAALRADTSGGHAVEIAQLEKEIAEAQQNYGRTLEDQLLDKLSQQQDEATKQRERQINLLEAQRDLAAATGTNVAQVNEWLRDPERYQEQIKQAWLANAGYDEATENGQKQLLQEWDAAWMRYRAISGDNGALATLMAYATEMRSKTLDSEGKEVESTINLSTIESSLTTIITDLEKMIPEIKTKFSVKELHDMGVSAATAKNLATEEITDENGEVTKKAPTAKEMVEGGFKEGVSDLYTAKEAFKSGITNLKDLLDLGYTSKDIKSLGFTNAKDFKTAGAKYSDVKKAFTLEELSKAGYKDATTELDKQKKEQTYKNKITSIAKKKKVSAKDLKDLKKIASDAGHGERTLLKALADTKSLKWEDVIKGFKSAGWSKYRLALSFNDTNFKKGFEAVYGKGQYEKIRKQAKDNKKSPYKYATGGLADYTGPAWLDGTPSRPELVLNATDTKNFIALKDILSKAIKVVNSSEDQYGNATYEININVDKIANDYDVDKMAERVKKIIVKDSSYRNVTQVRKFR